MLGFRLGEPVDLAVMQPKSNPKTLHASKRNGFRYIYGVLGGLL